MFLRVNIMVSLSDVAPANIAPRDTLELHIEKSLTIKQFVTTETMNIKMSRGKKLLHTMCARSY